MKQCNLTLHHVDPRLAHRALTAGQSSTSVAKIFETISRVSCGDKTLSVAGGSFFSSAKRAQYKLLESQDSPNSRLEMPENAGKGFPLINSRP